MKIKSFILLASVLLFVAFSVKNVSAQTITVDQTITLAPTATPSPVMTKVEYDLPYPGLLPDNPLYNIKAIRDKIIEFLISDPAKKGEFYLLSSDKRLNTGYYLIIKGKDDMGVLYISKSNNYMSMAINSSTQAGERGKQDLQKIGLAVRKHTEVITDLLAKVDQKNKSKLSYELERLDKMGMLLKKK